MRVSVIVHLRSVHGMAATRPKRSLLAMFGNIWRVAQVHPWLVTRTCKDAAARD